jgi:hypothetical protein
MFDCPDNEMTIDDAKKEYESYSHSELTNEILNKICEYYNIRRSLYIECVKELDNVTLKLVLNVFPIKYAVGAVLTVPVKL